MNNVSKISLEEFKKGSLRGSSTLERTKEIAEYFLTCSIRGLIAEKMNNELTRYLVTIENYPELKANENFLSLQSELRTIEDELSNARNDYNNEVTRYNTFIESVPTNIVAALLGFKRIRWFQIEEIKKDNVNVKLD